MKELKWYQVWWINCKWFVKRKLFRKKFVTPLEKIETAPKPKVMSLDSRIDGELYWSVSDLDARRNAEQVLKYHNQNQKDGKKQYA